MGERERERDAKDRRSQSLPILDLSVYVKIDAKFSARDVPRESKRVASVRPAVHARNGDVGVAAVATPMVRNARRDVSTAV